MKKQEEKDNHGLFKLLQGAESIEFEQVGVFLGDIEINCSLIQPSNKIILAILEAVSGTTLDFDVIDGRKDGQGIAVQGSNGKNLEKQTVFATVSEKLLSYPFQRAPENFRSVTGTVQIGATRAEGGSRDSVVKIGGHRTLPYHSSDSPNPVVTFDCFDIPISLPKPIREQFGDSMLDPGEWARKAVEKFNAESITIHLVSTDPYVKDSSPRDASRSVEEVLQAVKVPIIIGGAGNPQKDPPVLIACAEVAEGEKCLIASANENFPEKANRRIAEAAVEYGHSVLSFTAMDISNQKKLNHQLLDAGLHSHQIVQDPTTAALGYGFEYSISLYERIKLAGLRGDKYLAMPCSSGTTNAWGAREAHRSEKKEPEWGPREWRGTLWEAMTALTISLAGADLLMMLHPYSVQLFKEMSSRLLSAENRWDAENITYEDWVTTEF